MNNVIHTPQQNNL